VEHIRQQFEMARYTETEDMRRKYEKRIQELEGNLLVISSEYDALAGTARR
jgi:hypothetical protein